jgi:hypothetical protein
MKLLEMGFDNTTDCNASQAARCGEGKKKFQGRMTLESIAERLLSLL